MINVLDVKIFKKLVEKDELNAHLINIFLKIINVIDV